ncbi:hypothetical protein [Seonamhaeicola marinus]|uniref:Uncharacterized protein n=1 Tax=Seonamhaeicola marinus TaxID=1912246 RepID=A0A5D0HL01_9FLAO|nr:hypothetical protein [Seonamhaeicola marinus]TYA72001.1 hypothetical protein FUA24_20875 [Seonamhaeicola marinus]
MFKNLLLKIPVVLLAVFVGLCSCDSRKYKNDLLKESITKYKDSLEPIELVQYIPEYDIITETDTLLSNGYNIKIKTYTDMSNSVLQSFKTDSESVKLYFREVVSDVTVFKNDKLIFNQRFNNQFFSNNLGSINAQDLDYINNDVYIEELKSLETNKVVLVTSRCVPRTHNCPEYIITIDENGRFNVNEIDRNART